MTNDEPAEDAVLDKPENLCKDTKFRPLIMKH